MTTLLTTDGHLLDLDTGTLHAGSPVRVVDLAVGRTLDRRSEDIHIDACGLTLMPGLIDAHVHAIVTTLDLAAAQRPATRPASRRTYAFAHAYVPDAIRQASRPGCARSSTATCSTSAPPR